MTAVVNATAIRGSGALTVLKQFIDFIPEDECTYIIFIDESIQLKAPVNVKLIPLNKRSFFKRFLWDTFGVKKWLKGNHIIPNITISLQNTNFRVSAKCPNYIYYHQSLPLSPVRWNVFKAEQRLLWFYKNIYPFFVKLYINSRTEIFVQLNWIKDSFCLKYKFPKEKVHVVFPTIKTPEPEENLSLNVDKNKINFFYPATSYIYKNHKILFEAFSIIDRLLSKKIVLYLTCKENDFSLTKNYQNIEIVYLGTRPHSEIVGLFQNVDALLFPSYIETLGLPLIEAASFGLPIVASDLPYAREVLDVYGGAIFVNYQDAQAWGSQMMKIYANPHKKFEPFHRETIASWNDFFEIIKQKNDV